MRKKILLISYHFPPSQAVGGVRIFNLAKHLPQFGWHPQVLTINSKYLKHLDYARLKAIPNTRVHATTCLPTILDAYLKLKSLYHSMVQMKHITTADLQADYVPDKAILNRDGLMISAKRLLISVLLSLPDQERGWILPAVLKAAELIKKEKFDAILTSCPPYSVHIIGLILNLMTGIKWIADFRDPWYRGSHKKLYVTTEISKRIEKYLESQVLRHADLVITTTQHLCDVFETYIEKELKLSPNKCHCQTNGFDEDILGKIKTDGKYPRLTITYTGSLYFGRTPEPVFRAISEMIDANEIKSEEIRIILVGHCAKIENKPIEPTIARYGLSDVVEVRDPVPYEASIKMVKKSHLALLLAPDQPLQIPAKVFDYIGSGTPILTITQKGATYDLIQSTGVGGAFDPNDIEGIKAFILKAMANRESLDLKIPGSVMARFTSKSLADNIAEKLDKIVAAKSL